MQGKAIRISAIAFAAAVIALALAFSGTITAIAGLPAPSSVTATRSGTDINVSWAAVPGATAYHVNYTDDHKRSWHRAHTNVAGTTATIPNTQPGKPYYASVSAVGGAWRDSSAVHAVIPKRVGAVTLTRANGEVTVSWTAPSSGETPTGYDVVMSYDDKYNWFRAATNNSGLTYKATSNIKDYLGYHAAVRAVGAHGAGPWRNSDRIAPLGPPSPDGLVAHRGDTFILAEWDAATGATSYEVKYESLKDGVEKSAGPSTTNTEYRITGLESRPQYFVSVRAVNAEGKSAWNRTTSYPAITPLPPSSVTVTRTAGATTMDVSWVQCSDNIWQDDFNCSGRSEITGFNIDVKKSTDTGWGAVEKTVTTYTSGSTVTVTGLDAAASYHVRIGVSNRVGTGWSATQGPYN